MARNPEIKLKDAKDYKGWATIEGRIFSLEEPFSEKVQQSGIMSDGTGIARFVIFASSDIESLEFDGSYRLEGVFIELWKGQVSIKINRRTEITRIPDIDLAADDEPMEDNEPEDYEDDPYARCRRTRKAAQDVRDGKQMAFT